MPVSELLQHKQFWTDYRWGMSDDLASMALAHDMRKSSTKVTVEPWMVKSWTTHKDYTYRITQLVVKPASAIRSGFFAIYKALSDMKARK